MTRLFKATTNRWRLLRRSQRGVMMTIVAAFSVALLAFFTSLGMDAALTKYASTVLRRDLDERCKAISFNPWIQDSVVKGFQNVAQDWSRRVRPGGLTIKRLRVYAPVADPASFAAGSPPAPLGSCNAGSGICTVQNCNVSGAPGFDECEYAFDGTKFDSPTQGFPTGFWVAQNQAIGPTGIPSVGTTVACDAVAEYNSWFSGKRYLSARAAYWRPPRGDQRGLTVAIAPQLTTDANDQRFTFPGNTVMGYGTEAFTGARPAANYTGSAAYNAADPSTNDTFSGYNLNTAASTPAQAQMLTACMNPAIMVRNLMSSMLLEYAMRSSFTRYNTSLYVLNPRNQDAPLYSGSCEPELVSTASMPNPPVAVVDGRGIVSSSSDGIGQISLGQDLANPQYQIPFITYNSGTDNYFGTTCSISAGLNAAGEPNQDGWINPWNRRNDPANTRNQHLTTTWQERNAVLAEQLRVCFQLYSGGSFLPRPPLLWASNPGYDPANFSYREELRPAAFTAGTDWTQTNDPWGSPNTNGLTAPELASILGSVQSCPNGTGGTGWSCNKPTPDEDISADLVGFFEHINPDALPEQRDRGFASPGLFPFRLDSGTAAKGRPFGPSNDRYKTANTRGLILFIHKPVTSDEAVKLRLLIENKFGDGSAGSYPITVIYMPTNYLDAGDGGNQNSTGSAIQRLRYAFNVNDNLPADDPLYHFRNKLFVFSPYLKIFKAADCPGHVDGYPQDSSNQAIAFRNYWYDLLGMGTVAGLGAPSEANCRNTRTAEEVAFSLISDRLFSLELRL